MLWKTADQKRTHENTSEEYQQRKNGQERRRDIRNAPEYTQNKKETVYVPSLLDDRPTREKISKRMYIYRTTSVTL
jgi:hypothetical protein